MQGNTAHVGFVGGAKKLLIGGQWAPSASGEYFDTVNPATGEVIAQLSRGSSADIDRAVAAARRAFEGPWEQIHAL